MKNIPLAVGILFLAVGGFLILQSQSWTTYVLPEIYEINLPVPPRWEVHCCGDTDFDTRHFVFNPKTATRDSLGNMIYGESIKITQRGFPNPRSTVEFSPTVSQEIRAEFTKRFDAQ